MTKNQKVDIHQWWFICIIAIILVTLITMFTLTMQELNRTIGELSEIQYLSSGTQRCVQIILRNKKDEQFVFIINKQSEQYLNVGNGSNLKVLDNPKYSPLAKEVLDDWYDIYQISTLDVIDENVLEIAADNYFDSMTNLTNAIRSEIEIINTSALNLQYITFLFVIIIVCILFNKLLLTSADLKRNKEFAKLASIDVATGLFNRSKCQELFKESPKTNIKNYSAIVVIDLNDLKKTNDVHGHRVGDELIYSFANILKDACNVCQIRPFLGRYGGDEFIIYHKNISEEDEITTFLKELNYLTTEFNKNSNLFTISYAIGYQLNVNDGKELNIREMFDLADDNMYKNKSETKKQSN